MSPEQWAEVLEAGRTANAERTTTGATPAVVADVVLTAMADKCREIAARPAPGRDDPRMAR